MTAAFPERVDPLRGLCRFAVLVALAIGGGCEAQTPREQTDLATENVTSRACPARDCLMIEDGARYCSIDPRQIEDGRLFATKSTLSFSGGAVPLRDGARGRIPVGPADEGGLDVVLATAHGEAAIAPADGFVYAAGRDEIARDLGRWLEIEARFRGDAVAIDRFFLKTWTWPHDQFHLGDPRSMRWFFEAARNLFVRVEEGGSLYPGLGGAHIPFAPCDADGLEDRVFTFEFADGGRLALTARVINGMNMVGYYYGRLIAARGELGGETVDITGRDDLAFFGSTRSWAEMTIPGLAVRTRRSGGVCGVILDPAEWDTDRAVNGYVAYEMTCDERRGERLELISADYPEAFALP